MNPLNYASLEASKRLIDAGIVLETEAYWRPYEYPDRREWNLYFRGMNHVEQVPAPSMAEVWRELPGTFRTKEKGLYELQMDKNINFTHAFYVDYETGINLPFNRKGSPNPTDALIDLLIWVRKEIKS